MNTQEELNCQLKSLSEAVTDNQPVREIIECINSLCLQLDTESRHFDLMLIEMLSLNREHSLSNSVHRMSKQHENVDSLPKCFGCMQSLVERIPARCIESVIDPILSVTLPILNNSSLKSKRAEAYTPLSTLVTLCGGERLHSEKLNVSQLVEFCFKEINNYKKLEDGVKKGLYTLVGSLMRYYNEDISDRNSTAFMKVILADLDVNMNSNIKSPSYSVLEGALNALNAFLYTCPDKLPLLKVDGQKMYNYVKRACCESDEASRLGPKKAGLQLYTVHAAYFAEYTYPEYQVWYQSLKNLSFKTGEIKYISLNAMDAFLRELALKMSEKLTEDRRSTELVVNHFVRIFTSVLKNEFSIKEIALAAKSYGFISKAASVVLGEQSVVDTLQLICSRSQTTFFGSTEPVENVIIYVPQFCDAFASILHTLNKISEELWCSIESVLLLWYQHFATLDSKYIYRFGLVTHRIVLASSPLNPKFIDQLVEKCLLQVCCLPPTVVMADQVAENVAKELQVSVVDYTPLWKIWMQPSFKELILEGYDKQSLGVVSQTLFDCTMRAALKIMDSLNFDAKCNNEVLSDPATALQAEKPNDFCIFINLVELLQNLLPQCPYDKVEPWLPQIISQVVHLSTMHPLVSGFYKLITMCLKAYKNKPNKAGDMVKIDLSVHCYDLCSRYADEVLSRLSGFKDDLLVSCLSFLLQLPPDMIEDKMIDIAEALKMSLNLGLSYLPIAESSLDALEEWTDLIGIEKMRPLYKTVLPVFDHYLRTEKFEETDSGKIESSEVNASSKSRKGWNWRKRRGRAMMLMQMSSTTTSANAQLTNIRRRMALLLGSLGGDICQYVLNLESADRLGECVSWDMQKHLQFRVPFQDMKPEILLDVFLPRVCSLALNSGHRATKVAACELLHSLVLLSLGKYFTTPSDTRQGKPMTKIYKKLFAVVLKLACDVDEVPKQLFHSLSMQLIHWFTANKQFESRDTIALLQSILDGMMDSANASLRDHCATCLQEFVIWSVKHSSANDASIMNLRSVLKRLFSLAAHPAHSKRVAAALGFNAIYKHIREQSHMIDIHGFEILVNYMDSLALCHFDRQETAAGEQCCAAIDHIARILNHPAYRKCLQDANPDRRVPNGWSSAEMSCCIQWLVDQVGKPQRRFREKSMELLFLLTEAPAGSAIPHGKVIKDMVSSKDPTFFINRFEGGDVVFGGIAAHVCPELEDAVVALNWIDSLQAALDCYTFWIQRYWIKAAHVLTRKEANIFKAVDNFFGQMAFLSDMQLLKKFTNQPLPSEIIQIKKRKSRVIISMLSFVDAVLQFGYVQTSDMQNLAHYFRIDDVCRLLVLVLMKPWQIGFDTTDMECSKLLLIVIKSLTSSINSLNSAAKNEFTRSLASILKDQSLELPSQDVFEEGYNISDSDRMVSVIKGYTQLDSMNLLSAAVCSREKLGHILEMVFDTCFNDGRVRVCSPDMIDVCKSLMLLVGRATNPISEKIVECMMNKQGVLSSLVNCEKTGNLTKGTIFFERFRTEIAKAFAVNAQKFLCLLNKYLKHDGSDIVSGRLVSNILENIHKDSNLRKSLCLRCGTEVCSIVLREMEVVLQNWSGQSAEHRLLWIEIVQNLTLLDSKFCCTSSHAQFKTVFSSYIHILKSNLTLKDKNKALGLLGAFSCVQNGTCEAEQLLDALNYIVIHHFPLSSTEIKDLEDDYGESLLQFVSALSVSHSLQVLHILTSVLCREAEHKMGEKLSAWLTKYSKKMPVSRQNQLLQVPLGLFLDEEGGAASNELRLNCVSKVLIPMLKGLSNPHLLTFYLQETRVKAFMGLLEKPFDKTNPGRYYSSLHTKLGCMLLLQLMFERIDADTVKSSINDAYNPTAKNALIKQIVGLARDARLEGRSDRERQDLKLEFRCRAHNLLVSAIMCTQKEPKFYESFLFSDDVWDLISQPEEKVYYFGDVLNKSMSRKPLSALLNQNSANESVKLVRTSSRLQFLASQTLAASSLGSDLSQFDFTASNQKNEPVVAETTELRGSAADDQDYIEMDPLNMHPCMPSLLSLVKHLADKEIGGYKKEGSPTAPVWMAKLQKKLSEPFTSLNSKLLIARVVITLSDVFAGYARFWLVPFLHLALNERLGKGINNFRVDILATLLSRDWCKDTTPESGEEKEAFRSLLVLLIENAENVEPPALKRNVQLVDYMCQKWEKAVPSHINTKWILDTICNCKDIATPTMTVALKTAQQLAAVLMFNNIAPFPQFGVDQSKPVFFMKFVKMLESTGATVFKAAAELLGITFAYLSKQKLDFEPMINEVQRYLEMLSGSSKVKDFGKLILCLKEIVANYPVFSVKFENKALEGLKLHGEFRTGSLLVIAALAQSQPTTALFTNLRPHLKLLSSSDDTQKQYVVGILGSLVGSGVLGSSDVLVFVADVVNAARGSTASHTRMTCLNLCIVILHAGFNDKKVESLAKTCVINCLGDLDEDVRLKARLYWCDDAGLPEATGHRIFSLLKQAYDPANESSFLSYATYIMLERCSKSPDFNSPLFDQQLKPCQFTDMRIATSWKNRYASMQTPLFADSQAYGFSQTQTSGGHDDGAGTESEQMTRIRATQNPDMFSQTQTGSGMYDWLSGATVSDTFASLDSTISSTMSERVSISSLRRTLKQTRHATNLSSSPDKPAGSIDDGLKRLRRRIVKDLHRDQVGTFVQMANRRRRDRQVKFEERKASRGQKVHLYRSYRQGEVPDIQIPYSALIAPLQGLAQHDSVIASYLFESLMTAIFHENKHELVKMKPAALIDEIMNESVHCYAPLMTALMSFCRRNCAVLKCDAGNVTKVSIGSNQQHLAVSLLESLLESDSEHDADYQPDNKRTKFMNGTGDGSNERARLWIELARVYKSIGEFDQTRCIFEEHLNCLDSTKMGLDEEAACMYEDAIRCYTVALEQQDRLNRSLSVKDEAEQDLLEESRLKCLNSLNDWAGMAKVTVQYSEDASVPQSAIPHPSVLENLWDSSFLQENFLGYALKAHLKLLQKGEQDACLLDIINNWMNDAEKKSWLQTRHPCEIAWASLLDAKLEQSQNCCNIAIDSFLATWCELDANIVTTRMDCVQQLQSVAEMHHFLKCAKGQSSYTFGDLENCKLSMARICKGYPAHSLNSVSHWEDVIMNRCVFVEHIKNAIMGNGHDSAEIYGAFFPSELQYRLEYNKAAQKQLNFKVALQQLESCKMLLKLSKSPGLSLEYQLSYAATNMENYVCHPITVSPATLCDAIHVCNANGDLKLASTSALCFQQLAFACNKFEDAGDKARLSELYRSIGGPQRTNVTDFAPYFIDHAFQQLKISKHAMNNSVTQEHNFFMDMFNFCDRVLQAVEDGELKLEKNVSEDYACEIVESLLKAVQLDASHACGYLPRLFTVIQHYPVSRDAFITGTKSIPCWKLLPWLQQMLAFLSFDFGHCVLHILEQILQEYPKAFYYPVKLLFGSQSPSDKIKHEPSKQFLIKLISHCSSCQIVSEFLSALALLEAPEGIINDFNENLRNANNILTHGDRTSSRHKINKDVIEPFMWNFFKIGQPDDSNTGQVEIGRFFEQLKKDILPEFESIFGERGCAIVDSGPSLNAKMKTFSGTVAAYIRRYRTQTPIESLKRMSPWFSQFNAQRNGDQLEIPGQYSGLMRPVPSHHVTILGFDDRLITMSSLRKPKVVTLLGNDGREYEFMVKGGEDLRQDERIMQMQNIFNTCMRQDTACQQRSLLISTYAVIPLTVRLGLVEFVRNTRTLKSVMQAYCNAEEIPPTSTICKRFMGAVSVRDHGQFNWDKIQEKNLWRQYYLAWIAKDTPIEAENKLRGIQSRIKTVMVKKALQLLAQHPKDYLRMRSTFVHSYACMSVGQYILGVGDRHMSNSMLQLDTAAILGVDFGHAFGTAILLAIPETPPIRLTPQITRAFGPVGVHGQFESSMRHTMRVLRSHKHLLLSTMDIFVKEPSIDWLVAAKKEQEKDRADGIFGDETDIAQCSRIEVAKRKLNGDNPAQIIIDELRAGQDKTGLRTQHLNSLTACILACDSNEPSDDQKCKPRGFVKRNLDVNEQIRCLIDVSMDPKTYARVYLGYEPWL